MRTTTLRDGNRALDWRSILTAAGLALAFMFVASMLGALIRVPALALLVAAAAFLGVGVFTVRLRPGASALSAGLGAGLATALLSFFPVLFSPETVELLTPAQIALSVIVSMLFAFSLAWIGARLMLPREDAPPRSAPHQDAPTSV